MTIETLEEIIKTLNKSYQLLVGIGAPENELQEFQKKILYYTKLLDNFQNKKFNF